MSNNEMDIEGAKKITGFEGLVNLAYCYSTGISEKQKADNMLNTYKKLIGEGTIGSEDIKIDEFYKNDGVIETILGDYYRNLYEETKESSYLKTAKENYYKAAADKGNSRAMYNWAEICLAEIYLDEKNLKTEKNLNTEENLKLAFEMYLKAAKNGFALAQMRVAEMYFKGKGVDRNFREAYIWWSRAAKQKNLIRLENDSTCHVQGIGVIEKPKKAFKLWKKLYEESGSDIMKVNAEVAVNLGYCYEKGIGTKVNEDLALDCYKTAANVEIVDDKELDAKNAKAENADGLYRLGFCYEKGIGIVKNEDVALDCYKKAAELGSGVACFRRGMNYYRTHQIKDAVAYLTEAIKLGCFKACNVLAAILHNYSDKIDQAINLLQCAAQQGDREAQYNLGYMYIQKVKIFLDGKIDIDKFVDNEKKEAELKKYQKLVAYTMHKASANGVTKAKNFLVEVAKIKKADECINAAHKASANGVAQAKNSFETVAGTTEPTKWINAAIKYFDNSNDNKQ